jgi:protein ImuA
LSVAPNDTIRQLRRELLLLEGYNAPETGAPDIPIGPLAEAFPNRRFPTGKLHEFIARTPQQSVASGGFICTLAGNLMANAGEAIWITKNRRIFPPGLASFGISAHRIIFCEVRNEKHLLWATEEALRCKGLISVMAEIAEIDYSASLRLQLAIDESRVTGLLLRQTTKPTQPIASTARWLVSPARSRSPIPGLTRIGYPAWNIQLERVRNGHPGSWLLEWRAGRLQPVHPAKTALPRVEPHRKTG